MARSVFAQFIGLNAPPITDLTRPEPYLGEPCLHHKHGDSEVFRDGRSHACLACLESSESGSIGFSLDRLKPEHQPMARGFWNRVNITTLDDCWQWTAPPLKGMGHSYMWKRPSIRKVYKFHVVTVAAWLTWGDIGRHGITSICGQRRCANPLHQIPTTSQGLKLLDLVDMDAAEADLQVLKQQLLNVDRHLDEAVADQLAPNESKYMSKHREKSSEYIDAYALALANRDQYLYHQVLKH